MISFHSLIIHTFTTPADEIAHLKNLLEDKQQEVDEVEASFSEFQEFSKQVEEEMEQELKAWEKKYSELLSQHKRLKEEHENTVEKMARSSRESSSLINNLQEELSRITQSRNSQQQNIRKLEQENDTLEQRERVLTVSVGDLQDRLERVMEENVWLQSELDENRMQSDEQAQRLRDEIRDLKLEISIMERKYASKEQPVPKLKREHSLKDTKEAVEGKSRPSKAARRERPVPQAGVATAPNIGAAAISMVSDMLNLVKDLEVRIATYRHNKTYMTPTLSPRSELPKSGSYKSATTPNSSGLDSSNDFQSKLAAASTSPKAKV